MEDKKAYRFTIEAIVVTEDGQVASLKDTFLASRDDARGTPVTAYGASVLGDIGPESDDGGADIGACTLHTVAAQAPYNGIYFELKTGGTALDPGVKIRVAAKVEFQEVLFPAYWPANEEWEDTLLASYVPPLND